MIPFGVFSTLTEKDFCSIGKIVSHWAIAESCMQSILTLMLTHPTLVKTKKSGNDDMSSFNKIRLKWNDVIRNLNENNIEYLDLGIFISERGEILSKLRNSVCHWPASRVIANPDDKIQFFQLFEYKGNKEEPKKFTTESLSKISHEIAEWGSMVGMYGIVLSFRLSSEAWPLAPHKPIGEEPNWMLHYLSNYRDRYKA